LQRKVAGVAERFGPGPAPRRGLGESRQSEHRQGDRAIAGGGATLGIELTALSSKPLDIEGSFATISNGGLSSRAGRFFLCTILNNEQY
jgi:hypothetical protein